MRRIVMGMRKLKYQFKKNWTVHIIGYKNKYLRIELVGGLCNKLYCLFSACEIAVKENAYLIEPEFGWHKKILFSDIYDIDYFNKTMSKYYNGKDIMISRKLYKESNIYSKRTVTNYTDLWEYSEKILAHQRKQCEVSGDSFQLKVLEALKLKEEYLTIIQQYSNIQFTTAVQIRVESDWKGYSTIMKTENKEILLIDLNDLLNMLSEFGANDFFFTTGENQDEILHKMKDKGMNAFYFFDSSLEYEINAAINFEICCLAKKFIGLSRSTFSNVITLKRAALLNNDNSYIYNYNNKILKRIDLGLQPQASCSISKETVISQTM
jgi:hypothetical protein